MTETTPPGVGADDAKPPQGDTALRERLVRALARTVYRDDDPPPHVLRICEPWADALMPVIEAETADLRVQLDHVHEIAAACSHRAQQAEGRAYAAERAVCICTNCSPADYDGPQRDCPIHGEAARGRQRAEQAEAALQRARPLLDEAVAATWDATPGGDAVRRARAALDRPEGT